MSNKHQKHETKREQKPSKQSSAPVKPVELTDEELGQVVGGWSVGGGGADHSIQPDPTAVE